MKILLVSGTLSNRVQEELFEQNVSYGFAVQKFFHLFIDGCRTNDIEVEALTMMPIAQKQAPFRFKRIKKEIDDNISYRYVPFIRNTIFYHLFAFVYVFVNVFFWCVKNRGESYVCYDVLIPNRCLATMLGAILGRTKTIAIVTDMPGMSGERQIHYNEMGILGKLQMKSIYRSSYFVFLTEQTNNVLNPYNRPYIIVEGIVSLNIKTTKVEKNRTRDILYAGGIVESYGLGILCEAFMRLDDKNLRLIFYGNGPFVKRIKEYALLDTRIEYRGTAMNDVIVEAEKKATLLVNPRFTGADYTLYSFPSKNIEYMVSGTPLVTTKLAGIPEDYMSYIYIFEEETIEGYKETLNRILLNTDEDISEFGLNAQQYILNNKNSTVQVGRIKNMIKNI